MTVSPPSESHPSPPFAGIQLRLTEQPGGVLLLENALPLPEGPANLVSWLHQHAAAQPGVTFLRERTPDGWREVSYGAALAQVNRLANGLAALDLDPARPLATLSPNGIDLALFQLAAMSVGHPVSPISVAYSLRSQTGTHLYHILKLTRTPLLFLDDADLHMGKLDEWRTLGELDARIYAARNADRHAGVQPLDHLLSSDGSLSTQAQARFDAVTPQTVAKVQFTSGSTALPKGVEVTHDMMVSNQEGIAALWKLLGPGERAVDWLPWSHTFGGNFVFNMVLRQGGTLTIDGGSPTPQGIDITRRNILEVRPTLYFGVPRSYTELLALLEHDAELREAFFSDLKFMFVAAAALDQTTFERLSVLSEEQTGRAVPFLSAWGCTETAPDACLVYWPARQASNIGLPIPGVQLKLVPDASGKQELRVRGRCLTRGYFENPEATAKGFDPEGFYCPQDAVKLIDPQRPEAGLAFDGRIGEDFKLTSGTWVNNGAVRRSVNAYGQPYLLEVVPTAPNRAYLGALVFPNLPLLRGQFPALGAAHSGDREFLLQPEVREFFRDIFRQHNVGGGNSTRIERFILLIQPPQVDRQEATDKGYINQGAVLRGRAERVGELYAEPPGERVVVVDAG